MLSSSFLAAFLNNPAVAFNGLKTWSRKTLYHRIDLCTQPCYSEIIPGLYLSNARAAIDPNVLRHLNITHVLTIEANSFPRSTFENPNISTLFIRAYDTPDTNLLPYFPMANAFIQDGLQKGNVLVHCHFGVSRSPTLVIAYIMEKYELTFEQAFDYVRQRRPFINPNPGFINQLREYERLSYNVNGLKRCKALVNVNVRKHKYKIMTVAVVVVSIIVSVVVLILLSMFNRQAGRSQLAYEYHRVASPRIRYQTWREL